MKKIISILTLVCVLLASLMLASCADAPKEVIDNAIAKTNSLTSYEAKMTMNISVEVMGEKQDVTMVVNMKFADLDKEVPKMYISMESEELGEDPVEMYIDSEWVYMSMMGQNVKISYDDYKDELEDEDLQGYAQDILVSIPEDILKDVEVVKNDAGNNVVSVEIDSATFKTLFDKALETIEDELDDLDDVSFSNCKVDIESTKKGYIKSYNMEFDMVLDIYGVEANTHASYVIEFINPGEDVTVTPMEGYESFEEIPLF